MFHQRSRRHLPIATDICKYGSMKYKETGFSHFLINYPNLIRKVLKELINDNILPQ